MTVHYCPVLSLLSKTKYLFHPFLFFGSVYYFWASSVVLRSQRVSRSQGFSSPFGQSLVIEHVSARFVRKDWKLVLSHLSFPTSYNGHKMRSPIGHNEATVNAQNRQPISWRCAYCFLPFEGGHLDVMTCINKHTGQTIKQSGCCCVVKLQKRATVKAQLYEYPPKTASIP